METNKVIDLDLSLTGLKSIRIDGDDNRILKLNTSDLGIINRLKETSSRMEQLVSKASAKIEVKEDDIEVIGDALKEADDEMRACIDYVFNSNVSGVCAPEGTMFDPFNGKFRFEIIIEELSNLYGSNISIEMRKMSNRINAKTSKYTGK